MSASNQKKLRKEKQAAYMTERQAAEAKEKKKLKIWTSTFWIVIALCVCIALGTVLSNPVKNVIYKNTNAVTIGDYTLTAVEVNYFYIDAINNYCNQYSSSISYILDTTKPLSSQIYDKTTGKTWSQSFLEMAQNNIKSTYALYSLAVEKGHKLTEKEQTAIENMKTTMSFYATYYGYSDVNSYLRSVYGNGAEEQSYYEYYEKSALADSYYSAYADSLDYDAEALRAYEKDKEFEYNSYTYATYYLAATKFRTGGTKDDKGNITYSDDEKQAAIEECEKVANALAAGEYADIEAFNAAIKALKINEGVTSAACTENEDKLYSEVNTLFQEWLKSADRVEGELKVIANESGTGDNKVINGYYVIRFGSVNDNTFMLRNVRHILVAFEGGTYNSTTGKTTYSDDEKKEAKLAAQALLAQWEKGDKTEDSFAALANKESDDGDGTTGGLYEDIYPGQMVDAFEEWVYDAKREAGNYEIIETEYGYHIMYYVGESDINFRDFMIKSDVRNDDLEEWHKELVDSITLTELNLKYVNMDLVLGS